MPLRSKMWGAVAEHLVTVVQRRDPVTFEPIDVTDNIEALWGLKNWVDLSVWLVGREIDGEAKTRLTLFPEKRTTGSPEGEPHATLSNLRS
jgi:hypothetical protein